MAAARELSYLPFTSARAAARGGTGMLGLTLTTYGDLPVPYIQVPYYARLVLGSDRGRAPTRLPARGAAGLGAGVDVADHPAWTG